MSTHNIGFYEDLTKIIFQLSPNMHPISSLVGYSQLLETTLNITSSDPILTLVTLHYVNMPMQDTAIFTAFKNVNFQMKKSYFFPYFCSKHRTLVPTIYILEQK